MKPTKRLSNESDERDAIDSYFECVTACSIDEETTECFTKCVEIHLKSSSWISKSYEFDWIIIVLDLQNR